MSGPGETRLREQFVRCFRSHREDVRKFLFNESRKLKRVELLSEAAEGFNIVWDAFTGGNSSLERCFRSVVDFFDL